MFCTNCGKEIIEGAAFCANCGTKIQLPEKPAYEVAPHVAQPVAEVPEKPAYEVAPVVPHDPVYEAPEKPAYEVAPVVELPVIEETPVEEIPAYEAAPVVAEPVAEAPIVPAYEAAPIVEEAPVVEVPAYEEAPVAEETPVAQPTLEEPVYTPYAAPTEPVYEPVYNQSEEVKNNGRVGFGKAIALLFTNIVNFSGKASRSELWFGYLFLFLVNLGAMIINPVLGFLSCMASMLPIVSVAVRRIRDTGKDWNYIFMGLIPIVGSILLIITFCKETDSEKE